MGGEDCQAVAIEPTQSVKKVGYATRIRIVRRRVAWQRIAPPGVVMHTRARIMGVDNALQGVAGAQTVKHDLTGRSHPANTSAGLSAVAGNRSCDVGAMWRGVRYSRARGGQMIDLQYPAR